jgi:hypothetical protein
MPDAEPRSISSIQREVSAEVAKLYTAMMDASSVAKTDVTSQMTSHWQRKSYAKTSSSISPIRGLRLLEAHTFEWAINADPTHRARNLKQLAALAVQEAAWCAEHRATLISMSGSAAATLRSIVEHVTSPHRAPRHDQTYDLIWPDGLVMTWPAYDELSFSLDALDDSASSIIRETQTAQLQRIVKAVDACEFAWNPTAGNTSQQSQSSFVLNSEVNKALEALVEVCFLISNMTQ